MFSKYATQIDPEQKAAIVKYARRAVLFIPVVIALFFFAGFLAWTIRRQQTPDLEGLVTPTIEPDDDLTPEVTPA